jgi:glycosyltransferase involved in cell wall biosynthesis
MKVSIVMPAYNVAGTVKQTFDALPKDAVDDVFLVDDGSSDATAAEGERIPGLIVLRHPKNRGYGAVQKTGYAEALKRGADIVVMVHADFQYDPTKVPQMIEPLRKGECDMVLGSRFMEESPRTSGMPLWRFIGNRFLTTLQNMALGTHLSECHSGYRAYSRKLLENVPYMNFSDNFAFDAQMIAAVARRGYTIGEVPVPVRYVSENSSISFKASVRYGLATLKTLFRKY